MSPSRRRAPGCAGWHRAGAAGRCLSLLGAALGVLGLVGAVLPAQAPAATSVRVPSAAPAIVAAADVGAAAADVGAAANGYGPGIGPQDPGEHWGGAYTLAGVPGYGYCVQPGGADPLELPGDRWTPVAYPGSAVYSDGEMAALAYFAERYQGPGYPGWSVADTTAAVAEVAYASGGGSTPPASQAPAALVALVEQYMVTYAGPWTISLATAPSSGSSFQAGTTYSGTVTVTSATGNGVGGLQLTSPSLGGPSNGQLSSFVWLAGTTNAAGQISFEWSISGQPPSAGAFAATGINVVGTAVGTAPPAYDAPSGSGGQLMVVSGASEALGTSFGGTVAATTPPATGTISIEKAVPDGAYYGPAGARFAIENGDGAVLDTLTTGADGTAGPSTELPVTPSGSPYRVHETVAPPGYAPAPDQVVTVYPGQDTLASFTGTEEEPAVPAQLGAKKVDAQTGQALAGAVFSFAYDSTNDGTYDQQLGTCTTPASGICQPPMQNTAGGWLAGWYQVTETTAPPGYWLDPATTTQHVYLDPGATTVASVTFGDELLGSLRLEKVGNDDAYWPIAGAQFTVTGPSPSTAIAGTLTVTTGGDSNTLQGLVPGTYTITETTVPPGYAAAPSLVVAVAPGHGTTLASVADTVQPGQLTITKADAETGDPLAGATFDVRYDRADDGSYDDDLGTCTTNVAGTCTPPPDDATAFLPGDYLVTETAAPPGYALPTPPPSQVVLLAPGESDTAAFTDQQLVPATFQKVATGNVNPTELVLSGATIDVTAGTTYGGSPVATCTTDAAGGCTTTPELVAGDPYCWLEVTAPAGLAAGATGCFTATDAQGAQPITVVDPGLFVDVAVEKVDAANPAVTLPGAVFDLYRVDNGAGPDRPTPPAGAATEPGQTWVARATTGANGEAGFPPQLPAYAYCVVEVQAPTDYVLDAGEHCTGVLQGATTAPTTTLVLPDAEAQVTVTANKFNSAVPDTGIPGAVYDVYVEGPGPPSGPPATAPAGTTAEPGDTWWARGTTGADGLLSFTVPAGYAWCFHEVAAPADYVLDPALHCTAVVSTTTPVAQTTVALPETLATVYVDAHKYNAQQPDTVIPGATYELLYDGTSLPPGYSPPTAPTGAPVPTGEVYWAQGTSDVQGRLSFAVPAGYRWCLHELQAPTGYQPDPSFHCTATVTADTPTSPVTVALPEVPVPSAPVATPASPVTPAPATTLAFTGGPDLSVAWGGLVMIAVGAPLWLYGRRRRRAASHRGAASHRPPPSPDPTAPGPGG